MDLDNYVTIDQKCKEWEVLRQTVRMYLYNNRIPGAVKVGNQWFIPKKAKRPKDKRRK